MLLVAVALVPLTLLTAIALFAPLRQIWPGRPSFGRLVVLFVAGATALPLWILEVISLLALELPDDGVWRGIEAGLTEEAAKLAILLLLTYRLRGFAEPYTGMLCGVVVGLGFAVGENLTYAAFTSDPDLMMRAVMAIPTHASFGVIMGYWLSRAAASGTSGRFLALAYALPASFHVLHNVCAHFQSRGGIVPLAGIATDLGAFALALLLIHRNEPAGLRGKLSIRAGAPAVDVSADTIAPTLEQPPRFCGACGARTPGAHFSCRRCEMTPVAPS